MKITFVPLLVDSNSCHSLMINDTVYIYLRFATLDWLDQLNIHHGFSKKVWTNQSSLERISDQFLDEYSF